MSWLPIILIIAGLTFGVLKWLTSKERDVDKLKEQVDELTKQMVNVLSHKPVNWAEYIKLDSERVRLNRRIGRLSRRR